MQEDHEKSGSAPRFWGSRYSIGLLVIGAAAAYFLLTEHLAHTLGVLPYLFLLACPLMHVFMHHGHGHHHGHQRIGTGPGDEPGTRAPLKQGEPS